MQACSPPQLPVLYARNSNGSVQVWRIEAEGSRYRTITSKKGGIETTTEWTECEIKNSGKKNEISAEDQALKEAQAKHKKKIKEGYREDEAEIDNLDFREPMRANVWQERKHKVVFPLDVQYKLDGFRSNPQPDKNIILSRYNNPIVGVPHINALLLPFHAENPDLKLDGELYCHALKDDFNKLCSILRNQSPTPDEIEKCKVMELWIFDLIDTDLPWDDRLEKLKTIWKKWGRHFGKAVKLVWTYTVQNQAEWDVIHEKAIKLGFEGTMGRQKDGRYVFKRCDALLKRKERIDAEFEILDVLPGRGNKATMAAKLVCKMPAGSKGSPTFETNIKGNWDWCRELLNNKHLYIGKLATVEFQNYTPLKLDGTGGVPRQGECSKVDKF